jgi:hypothetical protein
MPGLLCQMRPLSPRRRCGSVAQPSPTHRRDRSRHHGSCSLQGTQRALQAAQGSAVDSAATNRLDEEFRLPLSTSSAVLSELFHLVGDNRRDVERAWAFIRSGAVTVLPISDPDLPDIEALMRKYRDRPMDFRGRHPRAPGATRVSFDHLHRHCVHRGTVVVDSAGQRHLSRGRVGQVRRVGSGNSLTNLPDDSPNSELATSVAATSSTARSSRTRRPCLTRVMFSGEESTKQVDIFRRPAHRRG